MKADLYVPSGVRVIRGNNLSGGREPEGNYVFVSEDTANSLASCCLKPGDLVFPHRGNIGEVGITPDDGHRYMLSTSLMKLSPDRRKASPLYLMYFFKSAEGRAALLMNTSQVGTPGIATPLKSLRGIRLRLPPLALQNLIAEVLGELDDRITLLRQTNMTLEAIAQALFKSWFVDFDPVRAKAEGREPEGMDEATAALFPDGFEELVPKGWMRSTVGETFTLTMGQSPPGETYNSRGDGLPFYQGRTDFGLRFPTQRIFCTAPSRIAETGDTLVSVRAPVGDVNMAMERCCVGRGVASVRHPKGYRGYTFYAMRGLEEQFKTYDSEGTVFGSINKKDFQKLPVISPSHEVLTAFESVSQYIDDSIVTNEEKIRTLVSLRDTLLPRLISGRLRLPEAVASAEHVCA
ncbi:restriction endonuclease subunit S [Hydrogenophaga sp.]|uniref:restriction endonuclease subunit S n=1 Tax=Hydrogenophaga sp. TaxID=1904254 RepID=UPI003F72A682